jgi:hypothetical protein
MKATRIAIDSEVFGRDVLAIDELSTAEDFATFERAYVAQYRPVYVSCKVPLERIGEVHHLERHGFELIECQIRSTHDLKTTYDMSKYPYRFERVRDRAGLDAVLEIATTTFVYDRFSVDAKLDKHISGERYGRYVDQSFAAESDAVFRLWDPARDRTVGFKTHRYLPNGEALLLLGGVHPSVQRRGLGVINTYGELNELRARGCKRAVTHISAANYHIFNVEIGKLGFRVVTTFAVLRKIYD